MNFTTRPELVGTFGMVSTTHWLASSSAMAVLEKGGNAFDAAGAAGFVLQIVEPHLNGPGGEVPILLRSAQEGKVRVVCGQGVAPRGLSIAHIRGLGLDVVPGTGLLPAVVPGAFGAWMLMLRDYGSLPLGDILSYAIGYAASGFPAVPRMCASILSGRDFFLSEWPTSAEAWLVDGDAPRPGHLFRSPKIAATFQRIVDEAQACGPDVAAQMTRATEVFYKGFVAEAVHRFFQQEAVLDTSGRRNRGVMDADDLASWQATYEEPVSYRYAGHEVHKTGPWGQGPVFLQQLALLKGFDLEAMPPTSPDFVHVVTECAKLAFADREIFYGDPDFNEVPIETLLSDAYNDARRKHVDMASASHELQPGRIEGMESRLEFLLANAGKGDVSTFGTGEPTFAVLPEMRGDTVHVDVVDRWGNMVSATPSGGWLQASPTIPDLGFCMTTRGQMFWLDEAMPSGLAPGRRPRTTLTPTLVTRDGEAAIALGTPGGDQQDQWSVQLLLRHLHHRMNLQEAIDAPTFQTAHFPASFYPRGMRPGHLAVEARFPAETIEALRDRGHLMDVKGPWDLGRLCAVGLRDGRMFGAASPRYMQGYAIGR
ncbi:gamma-glutamyltransferase family protein [Jiella sp. M17.18]|uniref:gamma-glutamyltransferase family protein n=1 Tax=Jiella sp. M17.18 TaxID=3234247 RepID=UPI0034DDE767